MSIFTTHRHSGAARFASFAAPFPSNPSKSTAHSATFWIPFVVAGAAVTLLLGALAVLSTV